MTEKDAINFNALTRIEIVLGILACAHSVDLPLGVSEYIYAAQKSLRDAHVLLETNIQRKLDEEKS